MKRSPMPPATKRINPMSKKRRGLLPVRALVRKQVLERDHETCQAAALVPSIECWGPLDVHEVLPRGRSSSSWLDPDRCIAVCRRHHDWIGANRAAAYALGLLVRSSHPSAKSVTVSGAPTGHQPVLADGRFVSELVYPPVTQDAESPE